jgi:NAD dependent epimerase/dehydratase family enzyme
LQIVDNPRRCACRDDLVSLIIEALQNPSYSGVYNGTAPNPVRMSELCSSLGASFAGLQRPVLVAG